MPGRAAQIDGVQRLVRESIASVDAIAPGSLRAVFPALQAARDEARADLSAWLSAHGKHGGDRFTGYQRTQALRALEATLERVGELKPAMAKALAKGRHETGPLAVKNLDNEVQRLSAIFGGGVPTVPQVDTAAVIARGDRLLWKRHERSAARYAGAVGDDIKHLFAVGVAKGETFEQLVTRLRRLGNPGAKGSPIDAKNDADAIANGLFVRHKHMADRLVRTELMHGYNVQHDEAIDYANEHRIEGDEEYLRRWDAAADSPVTCPRCKELDRTVTTIGGTFRGGVRSPPLHPYCRCTVLAWLARWGDMKGEVPISGDLPKRTPAKPPPIPPKGRGKAVPAEPEPPPVIWEHKKNPKRVAAAKKAADASVERRREIHSAVATNLPQELQSTWSAEGHKFMQQESGRIRGEKDRINAASKISQAFTELYGSGSETGRGYEGDRFSRRAEIEAKHAESWANDQERKHYAAAASRIG